MCPLCRLYVYGIILTRAHVKGHDAYTPPAVCVFQSLFQTMFQTVFQVLFWFLLQLLLQAQFRLYRTHNHTPASSARGGVL